MSKKTYSDEQIKTLHEKCIKSKLSVAAFARNNNLSYNSLFKGIKRLDLKTPSMEFTKRKFPVNDCFFNNIDTEEKAYILGFIFADGYNDENHHKLQISLAEQDKEILVKFSKILLRGNVNIWTYDSKKKNRQKMSLFHITSRSISDDLKKLGCPKRKTFILKFPHLPKHLVHHFIRGYFDGDGMLVIYERLMPRCINKTKTAEFSIVSTKEMLLSIGKQINKLGINYKIIKRHKNRKNNNFTLRVHGNQQIKKTCDFLYKDATIFLKRKHEKYLQLIKLTNHSQYKLD